MELNEESKNSRENVIRRRKSQHVAWLSKVLENGWPHVVQIPRRDPTLSLDLKSTKGASCVLSLLVTLLCREY